MMERWKNVLGGFEKAFHGGKITSLTSLLLAVFPKKAKVLHYQRKPF